MRRFPPLLSFPALMLLILPLLTGGCRTSSGNYQINIGNGQTARPAQEVEVSLDGKTLRTFSVIAPQKIAATRPRRGAPPQTVTVSWRDEAGGSHSGEVQVAEAVESGFRGQLVIQINADHTLVLMPDPARDEDLSPIPWNAPEAWEGSVMIPGFNE